MKVIRLSALCTGRLYSHSIFLVLISIRDSQPQFHSVAGRIVSMKIPIPFGIKPMTFWLIVHCLNQLLHRVAHILLGLCCNEVNYLCLRSYKTSMKTAKICSSISQTSVSHLKQNTGVRMSYITCNHI
jgi:hypothetical protein